MGRPIRRRRPGHRSVKRLVAVAILLGVSVYAYSPIWCQPRPARPFDYVHYERTHP